MEPEIKTSISDTGARRHLFEVLPMLRLDSSVTVTPEEDSEPWIADLIKALKP